MTLEFTGTEHFPIPPESLFAKLTDLDFVAEGIPDLVSAEKVSDTEMTCRVRPGFAFLRGTLDVSMALVDLSAPTSARMKVAGKGIGASLELETTMEIDRLANGCELRWRSEVTKLGGLLKSVSKGLIQGAAAKVSADVWADLHRRLDPNA